MWAILLPFCTILAAATDIEPVEQPFEDFAAEALTALQKDQQALATDINTRLLQEHDAYQNLLRSIQQKQKELQDNLYQISADSLLELQELMRYPFTTLQLFVEQATDIEPVEQPFEDFAAEALTALQKDQQALATDINTRLLQEHDAYQNLLRSIQQKQKELQDNLYQISADSLLELQELMRYPFTTLQLFVEQDIQKEQAATEAAYLQLLVDIKRGLRENKRKCGDKAIDLNSRTRNFIFSLAFIALQKPEFYMAVYTCDVVKHLPNDCSKVKPFKSGIKPLHIGNSTIEVLCDNEHDDGGWSVILQRLNGHERFDNRNKDEYIDGFGNFCDEFFIGIRTLQMILAQNSSFVLRVEVTDFNDQTGVAHYDGIRLMSVDWQNSTTHHLDWLGPYSGNAGDSLSSAVGSDITAPHRLCNLFGEYSPAETVADEHNMMWSTFSKNSLKSLRLLIRLKELGIPEDSEQI